ncbi:2,3-diketo-L-gulonate reductase [Rufibacter radiotolerans]|uniref:2,3-diketo-L-gulonate reductase n=1 Tax=Rufibacter radiotolerans TaxID=1379910 RepID=A0A0H4W423_9BACT|nr:3-dehydro-L-gulonate 2-dehydrogenase [Rufibacter radiotolerans]AKQ45166.1 2,3-diketo-L-gulonate reductase [Rufibacter radiotolerans]
MRIPYSKLKAELQLILEVHGMSRDRAAICAGIFSDNSRDGVYSHGLNRFPTFIQMLKDGLVKPMAEPERIAKNGAMEQWDGQLAPGMYTATLAMDRAIDLAREFGLGAVAVRNTNHWMRGGTYGWQAADAGCIGFCTTNTIANMPPWGGTEPTLGNNPLVLAVPRAKGHVVLDMALSQYSYGKMQEYALKEEELPLAGGYDEYGELSRNPTKIREAERPLPIGYWKGSGLSLVLDVLVASLSGGRTVAQISSEAQEAGVSQFFLCMHTPFLDDQICDQIIEFTKTSAPVKTDGKIRYPGESTLHTRQENEAKGIPVDHAIWEQVRKM